MSGRSRHVLGLALMVLLNPVRPASCAAFDIFDEYFLRSDSITLGHGNRSPTNCRPDHRSLAPQCRQLADRHRWGASLRRPPKWNVCERDPGLQGQQKYPATGPSDPGTQPGAERQLATSPGHLLCVERSECLYGVTFEASRQFSRTSGGRGARLCDIASARPYRDRGAGD